MSDTVMDILGEYNLPYYAANHGLTKLAAALAAAQAERDAAKTENERLRDEADYGDGGAGYLNAVNHGTNEAVRVLADVLDRERPRVGCFGGEALEAFAQRLEGMRDDRARLAADLAAVRTAIVQAHVTLCGLSTTIDTPSQLGWRIRDADMILSRALATGGDK